MNLLYEVGSQDPFCNGVRLVEKMASSDKRETLCWNKGQVSYIIE